MRRGRAARPVKDTQWIAVAIEIVMLKDRVSPSQCISEQFPFSAATVDIRKLDKAIPLIRVVPLHFPPNRLGRQFVDWWLGGLF